jgi:hypothetical protein
MLIVPSTETFHEMEVASDSAASFNDEDEAEELARLEAELRALGVEEEALAREEVDGRGGRRKSASRL